MFQARELQREGAEKGEGLCVGSCPSGWTTARTEELTGEAELR